MFFDILLSLNVKLFLINLFVIFFLFVLYVSLCDLDLKVINVFFCCILVMKKVSFGLFNGVLVF